jgi:RNA polymerase sigma-70 factor (ECF subfamily)
MSTAVDAGQPVHEKLEAKRDSAKAPAAPAGFFDAAGRYSGAARKPRLATAGADNRAQKRRYPLYADEDLMRLVGLGDAAAFAVLYDRHGRTCYSLAYRMMGEKQAAEDLTQDAFLKVWRSAGGYRSERGSVRTWILSIVHNRGIDQLRSLASRRRTQDRVEQSAPRSQPSEAFAEAWRNRQRDQIREALNTLPSEQLKILELAYFSGYTHVEISNLLGLPLGTVKGRMRLGLKKIREYFDQESVAVPR